VGTEERSLANNQILNKFKELTSSAVMTKISLYDKDSYHLHVANWFSTANSRAAKTDLGQSNAQRKVTA